MVVCPGTVDYVSVEASLPSVAVTAVTVLQDSQVLAALSSYLVNLNSSVRLKLFKHQAIHHLVPSGTAVMCCGGRSICVVEEMSIVQPERRLTDWIISAGWLSNCNIAVLFSYNSVALLDTTLTILKTVQCNSCCIIYGGCLVVEGSELVCCSGTVLNEPLLWKPFSEHKGKVLAAYTGHSGVIFDIKLTDKRLYSVSDDRTLIIWDRFTGGIVRRLYGHKARVLKVCLMPECGGVVSIGEDNQCVVWCADTGDELLRYSPHSGHGVRSVACKDGMIVTGGWDSSVVEYHKPNGSPTQNTFTSCFASDPPKWVSWLTSSELLVQLASGELRVYDSSLESFNVIFCSSESSFKDYSTMCKVRDFTVIGGITGAICLLDNITKKCNYIDIVNQTKIYSLTTVGGSTSEMFISCQEKGAVTLWVTCHETLHAKLKSSYILPKSKNRWITAAYITGKSLIIGDRKGGVHLYELENTSAQEPLSSIAGLHGDNGVSEIMHYTGLLATIGRDGTVRFFKSSDKTLTIVKMDKPLLGVSSIEIFDSSAERTVVYYFHGQCFKGTVLETGDTFMSVQCGGGHRSWDLFRSDDTANFAYISSPDVKVVRQSIKFNNFTRHGRLAHGADIHSAVYIHDNVITASEDCSLMIHSTNKPRKISGHISSVRTLCATECGFVFSAGGRGSLKAWRMPTNRPDLELLSDYSVVSETHIPVGYNSSYKFDKKNPDNDQRVISISCCLSLNPLYACFVVCGTSNGYVYLLGFTPCHTFVRLLTDYQDNCITHVKLLYTLPDTSSQSLVLVSSTTFGMVHCIWVQHSEFTVTHKFGDRLHNSGINGLDVRIYISGVGIDTSELEVLTIGDDGDIIRSAIPGTGILKSLELEVLTIGDDGGIIRSAIPGTGILKSLASRTVHFSAGISARFLDSKRIVSVGSDQRLVILDLSLNPIHCCYVDVPDPHDLVLSHMSTKNVQETKVLVCGKGFQEFDVSTANDR